MTFVSREKFEFQTISQGLILCKPRTICDERGSFQRIYERDLFECIGFEHDNLQVSLVRNKEKNVLRGLHFQNPPFDEKKLVHVIQGSIFDVVVNIQPKSSFYGDVYTFKLDAEKNEYLLVGSDFAHGYLTLQSNTIVMYVIDNQYCETAASGINFLQSGFNIPWPISVSDCIQSKKDQGLPKFELIK